MKLHFVCIVCGNDDIFIISKELQMQLIKKAMGQEWKSKRFMKSLLRLVDAEEDDVFKKCLQKVDAHFRATHNRVYNV